MLQRTLWWYHLHSCVITPHVHIFITQLQKPFSPPTPHTVCCSTSTAISKHCQRPWHAKRLPSFNGCDWTVIKQQVQSTRTCYLGYSEHAVNYAICGFDMEHLREVTDWDSSQWVALRDVVSSNHRKSCNVPPLIQQLYWNWGHSGSCRSGHDAMSLYCLH